MIWRSQGQIIPPAIFFFNFPLIWVKSNFHWIRIDPWFNVIDIEKKQKVGWCHVHKTRLLLQKKCSMIYSILRPKAEEGWIKPDQCQVNSTWLELTYYIETLVTIIIQPTLKSIGEIQLLIFAYTRLLNKPYEDEVF